MMPYKILTLTQPYATLIALGCKHIETRGWYTDWRGPLLIHAAAGLGPVGGKRGLRALVERQPFNKALCDVGSNGMLDWWGKDVVEELPRGAIVAVAELVCCKSITVGTKHYGYQAVAGRDWPMTDQERAFGDYSPGRYAWLLADVRRLPEPIPAKGQLGLWTWEGELP